MVRFFELLDTVSQRVLSEKASSHQPSVEPISAGIDKLNGYFTLSISSQKIFEAANLHNLSVSKVYLKDRSPYLKVSSNDKCIHLKLDTSQTFVTQFVTNPNHFENWIDFVSFFKYATGINDFSHCLLTRLDLNIDYPISFKELIGSIDLKNKRASVSYIDESGERTGLNIGKGNETVIVYDKAKQLESNSPLTRIELRLKQNKLPCTHIEDIPKNISSRSYFESISLLNIRFHQTKQADAKQRLERFKAICQREGYFIARKSESKSRNFDRDFKNLITIEPNITQPTEQFERCVSDFINPKKEKLMD